MCWILLTDSGLRTQAMNLDGIWCTGRPSEGVADQDGGGYADELLGSEREAITPERIEVPRVPVVDAAKLAAFARLFFFGTCIPSSPSPPGGCGKNLPHPRKVTVVPE